MKYSVAFSLELSETVTAEDAFSYYHQGLITKNDAFLCNTEGCKARLLCANIDRLPDLRKREPYFRINGELESHNKDCCPFHPDYDDGNYETVKGKKKYELGNNRPNNTIIFLEEQPVREHVIKPDRPHIGEGGSKKSVGVTGFGRRTSPNLSRHFRLRPLVRKFLGSSEVDRDQQLVRIGQREICMNKLFFSLNRLRRLPLDEKYLFYGMGYIEPMLNNDGEGKYKLKFHYSQHVGDAKLRPTVFIRTEVLERFDERALLTRIITTSLLTANKRVDIYVYGRPILRGDGKFINIDFDSLNHIYFFPRNYADEG